MSATLEDWVSSGVLRRHETSAEEIADLLGVVDRDLSDCRTPGLSSDWRLAIAYNGALQAAKAALAAAGYRVAGGEKGHHYRLVESLRYTADLPAGDIDLLQQMRKKRNLSDYELAGAVSDSEADEMAGLARRVLDTVVRWLEAEHPDLFRSR